MRIICLGFSLLRLLPPLRRRAFSLRLVTAVSVLVATSAVQADDYLCYDVVKNSGTGADVLNWCASTGAQACDEAIGNLWTNNGTRYIVASKYRPIQSLCPVVLDNGTNQQLGIVGTLLNCPGEQLFNYDTQQCVDDLAPTIPDLYALAFTAIAFIIMLLGFFTPWLMNRR